MDKLPREQITDSVEVILKGISTENEYYTDYEEVKHLDQIPTEYGYSGLYWADGRSEGSYAKNQKTKLWIEVSAVLVETENTPAYKAGTLALADLEKAFKSLNVCGAITTNYKSDKWVETRGLTVARATFSVCVEYRNEL